MIYLAFCCKDSVDMWASGPTHEDNLQRTTLLSKNISRTVFGEYTICGPYAIFFKARIPPFTALTRATLSFAHQKSLISGDGREADNPYTNHCQFQSEFPTIANCY